MRARRTPTVLTYHTVLPERPREALFLYAQPTVQEFEAQVGFLRRRCRPLGLAQYLDVVEGRTRCPRGAVLVTFDDGFAHSELAARILRRHGVPSVLFLAVDYVGTHRWPWYVALDRLIEGSPLRAVQWRGETFPLLRLAQRKIFRERFKTLYLQAPVAAREALMEELRGALRSALPEPIPAECSFLDWDGVRRLAHDDPLVEIGSHGLSHHDLTTLEPAALRVELEESQRRIGAEIGVEPQVLSYPDGRQDARVRAEAARLYRAAFAMQNGRAGDPMRLRRRPMSAGGEEAVRRVLSPLFGPRQRMWRWRARRGWI